MKLSDDMDSTLRGPGSPGPRRRWARKKTLAAALAVTAAAGVAGLTQVASASAATMGTVNVTVSVADANNAGAGQGAALNLCRSNFPSTQSVQFDHSEIYESGGAPAYAAQIWRCSDTP